MYTLRLILKGVIFLTMVKAPNGQDQLWLLLLDPGYKTEIHHEARLYVDDPQDRDDLSRGFDGTDDDGSYFDLAGNHLTMNFAPLAPPPAKPPAPPSPAPLAQPAALVFAKNTRSAGQAQPCFNCGSAFTFRQQKDDFRWVNALSEILKTVPLKPGHTLAAATELRDDIVAASYTADGLILARIAVGQGEVRTYTLWDEEDDPDNLVPDQISTYAFKKPHITCDPATDPHTAVAQTVAIELAVSGLVTFGSRSLLDETKPGSGSIVLKGKPGALVEVQISSMRHDEPPREGDFNAFYEMLKHPDYFQFLPLPAGCTAPDSGGACSPAGH
jgi:hypothetical protein